MSNKQTPAEKAARTINGCIRWRYGVGYGGTEADVEVITAKVQVAIEEADATQQQRIGKIVVALRRIRDLEQAKHDAWVQSRKDGFNSDIHAIADEAIKLFERGSDANAQK